jgi:hypothetical protein
MASSSLSVSTYNAARPLSSVPGSAIVLETSAKNICVVNKVQRSGASYDTQGDVG